MIRSDESNMPADGDGRNPFDLIDLPQDKIDADWDEFSKRHIGPHRLFKLSVGMLEQTAEDIRHLEWCDSCRTVYDGYRCSDDATALDATGNNDRTDGIYQQELPCHEGAYLKSNRKKSSDTSDKSNGQPMQNVPDELRKHLHVDGPVLFPGEEVAFESWQFGRLMEICRDDPELEKELIDAIVAQAEAHLLHQVDDRSLLLVCFGRAMHRCGTRLAARFVDRGFRDPHVVLAHDFYSPTLLCNPREFRKADIVVLVDVVHTGGMLGRLMSACMEYGPRRVRGLALVDQSQRRPLCAEWDALWSEPQESRLSLDQFLREGTSEQKRLLRRFEPNDACVGIRSTEVKRDAPNHASIVVDPQLVQHIHVTGALKRDHVIGGKRYSYVVNVLDLLGKNMRAKDFVLDHAVRKLSDVGDKKTCLAYHAGRAGRAGKIAKLLGARLGWPSISIGTRGPTFALTDAQCRRLACYDTVVVADSAVRTGDSISAMARALSDKWLRKHTRFVAFCVLDSLSSVSLNDLSTSLGLEIRTLFKLPLAPPSEEIGHWTSSQKAAFRDKMHERGTFASIEQAFGNYVEPPRGRGDFDSNAGHSLDETKTLIDVAVAHAQDPNVALKTIDVACHESKPHLIRHLTVDEVVHDEHVQDLLLGVMYNSMPPSFKESAAFGLAAAENYDWMELEWLKCNRPFLASRGNAWKSIPLIEYNMKSTNHTSELAKFRRAAIEFRDKHLRKEPDEGERQQLLLEPEESGSSKETSQSRKAAIESRVRERLEVMIEAGG